MTSALADRIFDYVIIGSGSAGSAIAFSLAEAGQARIAVIEFGGSDAGPFIQMPAALSYPMNMPQYDWGYHAEAEDGLNGRALVCPRGKVIGGSSSINGMIYVRGNPLDYDHWRDQGAAGWVMQTYCLISGGWNLRMAESPSGVGQMVRCISPEAHATTLYMKRL